MQMQLIRSERDFHFVVITLFYSASLMDTEISGLLNVSQQAITKTRHSEFHFIDLHAADAAPSEDENGRLPTV